MRKINLTLLKKVGFVTLLISVIFNVYFIMNSSISKVSNEETIYNMKQLDNSNSDYLLRYINNEEYTPSQLATMINSLEARLDSLSVNNIQTQIDNLSNKNNSDNMFLKAYPIGSIYTSITNTNPGSIFGGTWEAFGTGRTLVGIDTSQAEFDTTEEIGGSKLNSYTPAGTVGNHTLTLDEIPSHDGHIIKSGGTYNAYINSYENKKDNVFSSYSSALGWTILAGNEIFPNSRNLGGGGAHNHPFTGTASNISTLQPYITVYMWKRTA